jgi:hypothetical protein
VFLARFFIRLEEIDAFFWTELIQTAEEKSLEASALGSEDLRISPFKGV